jgi:hypothetical protein
MAFEMNASGTFQGDLWYIETIYLTIVFDYLIFQILGRREK